MQRVGVVGAGTMGGAHASSYHGIQNAKVVAVADIRAEAAAGLAARYDAEAFPGIEEMLAGAGLDVVDVCVPTPWHGQCIKAAANAGKQIVTEKPLARTLEECREAIQACENAGVTLFVAQVLRYFPEFVQMKEIVDSGRIGKPVTVRTTRASGFPKAWENWYSNFEWSGGVTLDMIIHDFDWILWTFGPAERVFAKGLVHSGMKEIDYALVTIRLKSGAIAHVEGSWARPSGFSVNVEIAGDGGLLNYDSDQSVPLFIGRRASEGVADGVSVPSSPLAVSPYLLELEHFINCVEAGRKPDISPTDGMNAVEVALAAIESMKTGKPVQVGKEAA